MNILSQLVLLWLRACTTLHEYW